MLFVCYKANYRPARGDPVNGYFDHCLINVNLDQLEEINFDLTGTTNIISVDGLNVPQFYTGFYYQYKLNVYLH